MKRKNNLYMNICNIENIMQAFNEVCKNTKNKRKVNNYREYKCIYISRIYNTLKNKEYKVGKYNVFTIYEPKKRRIVSQNMFDKIVNHLVARQILIPTLIPCLINQNVASRKEMGTSKALEYFYKYRDICNCKYKDYYILKCDIKGFFYNVDHEKLKEKVSSRIKDKDALKIVFDIIDSEESGIPIGNMTSQILAIFYLNDMDHFIKENLKIKYYVRYQDDFILFHKSKKYLKKCLKEIIKFLEKEKLELNRKSKIYKNTNHFIYLGKDRNGRSAKYRQVNRKIKKRIYLYKNKEINIMSLTNTIMCYKNIYNNRINTSNINKNARFIPCILIVQ